MIVGNGLLANEFIELIDELDDYVIFAAGVSDSSETDVSKFNRERDLILKTINENNTLKFIYFSSILAELGSSDYYNHNLEMENLVKNNVDNYVIFRLPQVIGRTGNKKNLLNHFENLIRNDSEVIVYEGIMRSLIDIEDVVDIVDYCKDKVNKKTINVSGIEKIGVISLVKLIGEILNVTPKIKIETDLKYVGWLINNSPIVKKAISYYGIEKTDYTYRILKKYII